MKYRAEIDGLRALAVVPVILFHAGIEFFNGGFLGVDVFFVISGFLITSILYEDKITGNFSIIKFYDRRIRRILPPLILTAFITIAIASSFTPSEIKNVGQSLVATFTFLSNYFFYLETDYFNPFNQTSLLLHTWSISVEEQYYIFAPFLIYIVSNFRLFKYAIILGLVVVSFYFSVNLTNDNPNLSFYSIHTRVWELLIGMLLAFICKDYPQLKTNKLVSEIISILSIIFLVLCFIAVNKSYSHPSYITILPVLSTAALIYFTLNAYMVRNLLSNRILVGIGLISYSLYLLHNPIFSAIKYHFEEQALLYKVVSIPLIVLLSFLSFKYIETPSRNLSLLKNKIFHLIISILVILLLSIGYLAHTQNGFLTYFKRNFNVNTNLIINVDEEKKRINDVRNLYYPSNENFECNKVSCQNILVIGDSLSEDAYLALRTLENKKLSVRRIYYDDECLYGYKPNSDIQICNDKTIDISLIKTADIIIITENWQKTTYKYGFKFAESIANNFDANVILLGSISFEDISSFAFRLENTNNDLTLISKLAYASQRFDWLRISNKLRELVNANSSVSWIEKSDFFCNSELQICNLYDSNFNPLIWDSAHLTSRAYLSYGKFLITNIRKLQTINE